jgi:hypothetical protein
MKIIEGGRGLTPLYNFFLPFYPFYLLLFYPFIVLSFIVLSFIVLSFIVLSFSKKDKRIKG